MDDNSVYRELFFEETDDHLQQLNDNVLGLEKNPSDMNLLNEIFRSAHTLKGMAATMGYDVMTNLTHKMENIVELFKEGKVAVTSASISLIFSCLDTLQDLVEQLRADEELDPQTIQPLIERLQSVEEKEHSAITNSAVETTTNSNKNKQELKIGFERLEESDCHVVKNAQMQGHKTFSILVRVEEQSVLKGARAFLVMEKLEQEGDVIHSEPSAQELEEGAFETDFQLLYVTVAEKEEIEKLILSSSEIEAVVVEAFEEEKHQLSKKKAESKSQEKENKQASAKNKTEKKVHKKAATTQSIRVDLSRLDLFLNLVSELVVYRNQLEEASSRANMDDVKSSLEEVSRLTTELQDLVLKIRMQQVSVVFSRFPRMVRDLANELNKEMELIISGEETELDKTVVSELSEPLIHILRNSADHGIESPEKRQKLGKDSKGTIRLSAFQEGNQVMITIEDDGKGMDPEAIQKSAENKGIDTSAMTEDEILHLIFHPGFSTAKKVTNISGRGVGLDVVQSKINTLGGTIELRSQHNVGTKFIIKLPLTLSIIEALMVTIGSETFAVPLDVVDRVVRITEEEIQETLNQEVYAFQSEMIPIIRTQRHLGISSETAKKQYAIIVKADQHYYGILVDELIGQQEIVIKKIDPILQKIQKYQGATILGDGSIALILDIPMLCQEMRTKA